MVFMMAFGIGLRASGLAPEGFIAVFYTGLGPPADGGAPLLLAVSAGNFETLPLLFPSYCYNGREFNAHAVAAVPQNGKPVELRRSLTSTVSADEGAQAIGPAGLRRRAGGGSASQETRCRVAVA